MDVNELLDRIEAQNLGPKAIAGMIADAGLDPEAVQSAAQDRLQAMKSSYETDTTVTIERVNAIKSVLAATDTVTPQDQDADAGNGSAGEDDVVDEPNDGPSDDTDGRDLEQVRTALTEVKERAPVGAEVFRRQSMLDKQKTRSTFSMKNVLSVRDDAPVVGAGSEAHAFGRRVDTYADLNRSLGEYFAASASGAMPNSPLLSVKTQSKYKITQGMSTTEIDALLAAAVSEHAAFSRDMMKRPIQERQNFGLGACSPSVQHWEFCPIPSPWGRFQAAFPVIASERGGHAYPVTPSIGDVWAQGIFCFDEEQEKARVDPKPCATLDCTNHVDYRDRYCWLCVTTDVLADRAWPELRAQYLATYDYVREAWMDWQMLRLAMEIADVQQGHTAGDPIRWDTAGYGILNALIEKVEFGIDTIGARAHLDPYNHGFVLVIPSWAFGAIRADLSKRVGVNNIDILRVTPTQIEAIVRGGRSLRIVPHSMMDTYIVEPTDGDQEKTWFGSDISLEDGVYPETMEALLFPDGAIVGVRDDFLDIRAGWDYGLQRDNKQIGLISESAWNVIPRCYEMIHFVLDICVAGRTSAPVNFPCNPNDAAVTLTGSVPAPTPTPPPAPALAAAGSGAKKSSTKSGDK